MSEEATALQAQASRLELAARAESRAARRHRRRAKQLFEQLNALLADCAARGVSVRVEIPIPASPSPQGGPSDHHKDEPRQVD